jgi:hypothetical protein
MTTLPTADHRFPFGSSLVPLELEVQSFPFDPSADGYTVTLQAVAVWSNELMLENIPCTVEDLTDEEVEAGRFRFRVSTLSNFPAELLPPGQYHCAFVIEDGEGRRGYLPASGRLAVEILPAPVVGP